MMFDDDGENVHYDLSEWSIDAQSVLVERLAEAGIEHAWEGRELVVSDNHEAAVDAIVAEVESLVLASSDAVPAMSSSDEVEYDLVSWSDDDRRRLSMRLADELVRFRWEGSVLVVKGAHEAIADRIIGTDLLESD